MRRSGALLAALALAGCTVGPTFRAPAPPAPPAFGEVDPQQAPAPAPNISGWWRAYQDPELDRLVAIALADGIDIRIAASRIAEARAQEAIARSQFFPQLNASGNFNYEKLSKNAGISSLASAFGGGAAAGGARRAAAAASPFRAAASRPTRWASTRVGRSTYSAASAVRWKARGRASRRRNGTRATRR